MSIADYYNFDLLITRAGERYRAIVVDAPAGEASVLFDLPFAVDEATELGAQLSVGATDSAERAAAFRSLGSRLFEAVFQDRVGTLLTASLSSAVAENEGLRIRLRFEEDAAGLALLPWELLYDSDQRHFVGLGEQTPILRYLALPRSRSALLVEPPLRVLAVLASPADLPRLDLEREWQAVQHALASLTADGKFALERLANPTLDALQQRLLGEPVHVLHFVGHGVFDETGQAGSLVLEDATGRLHLVRGDDLAKLLGNHPSLRLAYLSACQGALASGQSVFAGVAQELVQGGVPAAVAMQAEISDTGAIELARSFYSALAVGRPVDAALTQARVALSAAGSAEWAIPVLFSRSPDNRLFDLRQVLPTPACPYPGMVPFSEAQQELFFGRDKEIEDAVERLRQHPFLAVVGPSGSGKSSLVYAGVIPALRRTRRFGAGEWNIKALRPGEQPLASLAGTLGCSPEALADCAFDQRTLLFVDQFEELFTLVEAGEAQSFLQALQGLLGRPNLYILLAVRADFYPDLMACSLWPAIKANRLELPPLGDDALWAAIVEPAGRVGVVVDEALAVQLIADAAGERGSLPLVQETLVLLWEKVKDRRLGLAAYRGMAEGGRSGLQVAIDRRASSVYDNLPEAAQPIARRIFLRLIQFGEGRADTRRQQTTAELRACGDDPALFDATLARLVESRLLTAGGEADDAARRIDIAHEALIAGWPRLQRWLHERKEAEQTRRRLEGKGAEWVRLGRGDGGLLDRAELAEADIWLASKASVDLGVSTDLVALIEASRKAVNPGWHRWGTVLLVVTSLALVSLLGLAVIRTGEVSSEILRVGIWTMLVGLIVMLVVLSGVLRQRNAFLGQHLSQSVAKRRWFQVAGIAVVFGAIAAWSLFGRTSVATARYCGDLGYVQGQDGLFRLAVLQNEELDPFYLRIVKEVLTGKPGVKAWIVEPTDSERCVKFFDGIIGINVDMLATEVAYTATIQDLKGKRDLTVSEVRSEADCSMSAFLAHKVARDLGLDPDTIIIELDEPTLELCRPYQLLIEGDLAFSNGDLTAAKDNFEEAIALAPDYLEPRLYLTQVYMYEGEYAQAAAEAEEIVQLRPQWTFALNNLAVACFLASDYECASKNFASAIASTEPLEEFPLTEKLMAYFNLASALREQGRYAEAAEALSTVKEEIDAMSDEEQKRIFLGGWYKSRGVLSYAQGQWSDALRDLETAITFGSEFEEEITYYRAKVYQVQRDASEACKLWREYRTLQLSRNPSARSVTEEFRRNDAAVQERALGCPQ